MRWSGAQDRWKNEFDYHVQQSWDWDAASKILRQNTTNESIKMDYLFYRFAFSEAIGFGDLKTLQFLMEFETFKDKQLIKEIRKNLLLHNAHIEPTFEMLAFLLNNNIIRTQYRPKKQSRYDAQEIPRAMIEDIVYGTQEQTNEPKDKTLLYAKDVCKMLVEADAKQPLEQILNYLPLLQGPRNEHGESFAAEQLEFSLYLDKLKRR